MAEWKNVAADAGKNVTLTAMGIAVSSEAKKDFAARSSLPILVAYLISACMREA